MKYYFFKNSNEQSKNMFSYAEKYVKNKDNRYTFIHTVDELFQAFVSDDKLHIVHRMASYDNFQNEPYPYKTFKLRDIAALLDENESVSLVAVNVPSNISDQQLLEVSRLVVADKDEGFVDAVTKEAVFVQKPTAILLFSAFKVGPAPIYCFITHSPFIGPAMEDGDTTGGRIIHLHSTEDIKGNIYPMKPVAGVQARIGNHILFANSDTIVFQVINPTVINPVDVDLNAIVRMEEGVSYTVDNDTGTLSVDVSSIPMKTALPLRVVLDGGPYFNWWINESQIFKYEYMIYRMA